MSQHPFERPRRQAARHVSRRAFLRWLGGLATLSALPLPLARRAATHSIVAAPAEPLPPGALAPEDWGPAGWYEAITAYVDCDVPKDPGDPPQFRAFRGQVIFMRSPSDLATYVYLAGHSDGVVVKGYRVLPNIGLDRPVWSTQELNISLGGGGGAQLRYDRDLGRLTLWLNGFVIGAPEVTPYRFGFLADVEVDRTAETSKSRVLDQGLGTSDEVQFYMRAGTRASGESNTAFLMIAHLSIRAPMRLTDPPLTQPAFPWPFPTVTRVGERLYVTQITATRGYTSHIWTAAGAPHLNAPTAILTDIARDTVGLNYHLPRLLQASPPGGETTALATDITAAPALAFTAETPTPSGASRQPRLLLSAAPTDPPGYQLSQAVGIGQAFLPHLQQAERAVDP